MDPGLLVVEGKVTEGRTLEEANEAVDREMELLMKEGVTDSELQKAKNKIESMIAFEDMSLLNRANNLAFYELMGDAADINVEWDKYNAITAPVLRETACEIFRKENCSTLFYRRKNNEVN
jgi:predicted Zn-dependent peptidase